MSDEFELLYDNPEISDVLKDNFYDSQYHYKKMFFQRKGDDSSQEINEENDSQSIVYSSIVDEESQKLSLLNNISFIHREVQDSSEGKKQSTQQRKNKHKLTEEGRETKNLPKIFGGHLRNFIMEEFDEKIQQREAILKFVNKNIHKNQSYDYNLTDFRELFSDPIGSQIGQTFFGSYFWIQRMLLSDRLPNYNLLFKYFKVYFKGSINPKALTKMKWHLEK